MHTKSSYTSQPSHNQEIQIISKYYVVILLIGFIFTMEDGLLNRLIIHKESNLSLAWLKQFGILTCVIIRNSKNVVTIYLNFSMSFLAVPIQNHTSNHEDPLMQMNSTCIAKLLLHML